MTRLIERRISALEDGRSATQQRAILVVRANLPNDRSSYQDWARSLAIRYDLPSECFAIVVSLDDDEPETVLIGAMGPCSMSDDQLDLLFDVARSALTLVSIEANSRVSVYAAPNGLDDLLARWVAQISDQSHTNSGKRGI